MQLTETKTCDLRLGDVVDAVVAGTALTGTIVCVDMMYATVAFTGWDMDGARNMRRDPDGVVLVGKHSEIKSIRPPRTADELDEWFKRPVIECRLCRF